MAGIHITDIEAAINWWRARQPHWYLEGEVPDTREGRFAALATLLALVDVRLESGGEAESWVYIYARPERLEQAGVTEVAGGDWCTVAGRQERGPDER